MTHIRWMIRRDMAEVLEIESRSFAFPWTQDTFIQALRSRNCIGKVAEQNETVLGYMLYECHQTRFNIINFAVHPGRRREGIGRAMCNHLIRKLRPERRRKITLEVSDSNLVAQLFFKAMGFKAIRVLRDAYDVNDDDAYLMEYRIPEGETSIARFSYEVNDA